MSCWRRRRWLGGDAGLEYENEETRLLVTPCMIPLLRRASELAEVGLVGHKTLLLGLLEEKETKPIQLLFGLAQKAGWSVEQFEEWVAQREASEPAEAQDGPDVGQEACLSIAAVLAQFGHDLTAERRVGKLTAPIEINDLLRRMKRLLIKPEVNNPNTAKLAHDANGPSCPRSFKIRWGARNGVTVGGQEADNSYLPQKKIIASGSNGVSFGLLSLRIVVLSFGWLRIGVS